MKNKPLLSVIAILLFSYLFLHAVNAQTPCLQGNDIFSLIGMRGDDPYITPNFELLNEEYGIKVEKVCKPCGIKIEIRPGKDNSSVVTKVELYGPHASRILVESMGLKGFADTLPGNIKWDHSEKEIKKQLKADKNFELGNNEGLYVLRNTHHLREIISGTFQYFTILPVIN